MVTAGKGEPAEVAKALESVTLAQAYLLKVNALSRAEALLAEAREGLRIIAGEQQCADNLMGDKDIARALLAKLERG